MNKIVIDYLHGYTHIEHEQLKQNKFVFDLPLAAFQNTETNIILLKEYFLKNNFIYISKHTRFASYPKHSHRFLELNYVYSGQSIQTINGEKELIKKGEILLLDKGTSHALELHQKNDILINIIFPSDNVDINWLSNLSNKDSILFNFLAQTLVANSNKNYLIFRCAKNQHIQVILDQILDIYFTKTIFANEIISLYIPILFTELISNCSYDFHQEKKEKINHKIVVDTLKLIENDYINLSLNTAAQRLGYNKNYLSNIIKKKTDFTFSELVTKRRMKQAKFLIENTQFSIGEIIEMIGLKNRSYFYKQFKETYHKLPAAFRKSKY